MRIMPVNNQNNYKNQTSFKNLIMVHPDFSVPLEKIEAVYKKEGFGYIQRRTVLMYENVKDAVKEGLATVKYRLEKPEEDFNALVRKAHDTGDDSLAKRFIKVETVEDVRPHVLVLAELKASFIDTSLLKR